MCLSVCLSRAIVPEISPAFSSPSFSSPTQVLLLVILMPLWTARPVVVVVSRTQ